MLQKASFQLKKLKSISHRVINSTSKQASQGKNLPCSQERRKVSQKNLIPVKRKSIPRKKIHSTLIKKNSQHCADMGKRNQIVTTKRNRKRKYKLQELKITQKKNANNMTFAFKKNPPRVQSSMEFRQPLVHQRENTPKNREHYSNEKSGLTKKKLSLGCKIIKCSKIPFLLPINKKNNCDLKKFLQQIEQISEISVKIEDNCSKIDLFSG